MDPSPISLVVTDLDGTLWHTDDAIDPKVVAAVATLAERGIPLLVATGRRLASTRRPLASVGLTPPAVILNGALGVDLATGERFHRAPFPADQAASVLAAFGSVGCDPVVHVDHPEVDAFLSPTPSTHPDHAASFSSPRVDLAAVVAAHPVLGFSMIGRPHAECVAAAEAVGTLGETHLDRSLDFAGLATLTVAPVGQSKWDGVLAFCAAEGLDPAASWPSPTAPTTSSCSTGPPCASSPRSPTRWPSTGPTTSSRPPPTAGGSPSSTTSDLRRSPRRRLR